MKIFLFVVLAWLGNFAFANHNCTGEVTNVDVSSSGGVHVTILGIGTGNRLCSIENAIGEYSAEACRGVLGLALSAKMAQKDLRLYFRNDTDTSCSKGNWNKFDTDDFQLYHVRIEG